MNRTEMVFDISVRLEAIYSDYEDKLLGPEAFCVALTSALIAVNVALADGDRGKALQMVSNEINIAMQTRKAIGIDK